MKLRGWIGLALMILAIPLGLYVGGWVMFVGGIVQVIEAIRATPVEAMGIALGALRVVCASAVGVLSFWLGFGVGFALISKS